VTRAIEAYCRVLSALMAGLLALMVVLVFGNVVLRYGFDSGITVSEEVSRWLFLWMTFFGAIVALKERAHLGTDFVLLVLPRSAKKACFIIAHVLMLYATWLVLEGSWAQMVINIEVQAPVTGASLAIFYASGVVFAVSAAVLLLRELWRAATGQATEDELVMTQESEELSAIRELKP
jgi:TRAP-type transport system small permease protein